MKLPSIIALAALAWTVGAGVALAHHSFAMFDAEHPIEVSGTVKEFRFVSPHTLLILEVKGTDGTTKDWMLEGGAPGLLVREGMTSKSLKPGDEITAKINPLHSGAAGGSYQPALLKFKDGSPVVAPKYAARGVFRRLGQGAAFRRKVSAAQRPAFVHQPSRWEE
jgi:hypothetical protein